MAAIAFPTGPATGEVIFDNGVGYQWTGTAWVVYKPTTTVAHAVTAVDCGSSTDEQAAFTMTSTLNGAVTGAAFVAVDGVAGAITVTGLKETKTAPAISGGTLTLNCAVGTMFVISLNASITSLVFANVPAAGNMVGLTLQFVADGTARTITWGGSVKWPSGLPPTLTSTNGKVDTFVLMSHDGGTTWYAFVSGQNS